MGILFDIVLVVLFLFFIYRGYRKGAVKTLLGFLGSIAAVVAAFVLSFLLADAVFSALIRPAFVRMANETLGETAGLSVAQQISSMIEALPGFISNALQPEQLESQISAAWASGAATATDVVVDYIARPIVVMLLRVVLVLILLIVFSLLVKLAVKTGDAIARLPLLTQLNSFLGILIGMIKGAFVILLLMAVLRMIVSSISEPKIFSQENISSSALFEYVYENNPLFHLFEIKEA